MWARLSLLPSLARSSSLHSPLSTFSSTLSSTLPSLSPSIRPIRVGIKGAPAQFSTSPVGQYNSRLTEPTNLPQRRTLEPDPCEGRQEMAKDGYGVTLYDIQDGKRKSLSAVVMRFKRLDWGAWIRPKSGRAKKLWKKSFTQLNVNEKHVFVKKYHKKRFDRAVTGDFKEVRHIPDDPYKVYNDMSWQDYHSTKLRNMELIKKYGAKNYNFHQYRAHYRKRLLKEDKTYNPFFEPPGYHADIASGLYSPDTAKPQDTMAPSYELVRRHASNVLIRKDIKHLRKIRQMEHWYGRLGSCHPLRLPLIGTYTG